MTLTAVKVSKTKATDKPQKLSDGGGLYLLIHPNGGKYWRLDYRFDGKRKTLALGVYPDVVLVEARERREEARKQIKNGVDPCGTKKAARQTTIAEVTNSFKSIALEYHPIKVPTWTEGHAKQWLLNLERYAFPKLGDRPISEIEPLDVVAVLRDLEERKNYETRDRLGQSIGAVFKYAIATGRAKYNPVADIRIALVERPKTINFKCIAPAELPVFLRAVATYESLDKVSPIAISAFKLVMLTATRTSEVRFAKWCDFDLDAGLWVIPEEQQGRKGKHGKRKAHTVPLSSQVIAILRTLFPITGGGDFVFPNRNTHGRVISENTILKIIETIGYKGRMTGHGFRSLARTILGEMGYRREVLEAMLSHAIENQTEAAYVRTNYLEERRGIMQKWADYLDMVRSSADIVELKRA
ncbi:integrase [Sulfuriferula sp. AH1]|uniref:tyrosine-type recombinase/integrase n=1 Tax=Sulfuriferula sp. AH1 TaxID=1985873 RepID=UPI000B3B3B50|nr:integrase arm-type DNA-binding domain-containing protein [Sulfuriferula sp. AH1]ARU32817.1 integrase [Sulfuriferula sp. AH1]